MNNIDRHHDATVEGSARLGRDYAVNALDVLIKTNLLARQTWNDKRGYQMRLDQFPEDEFRNSLRGVYADAERAASTTTALDDAVAFLPSGHAVVFLTAMHDVLRQRLAGLLNFLTNSHDRSSPACHHNCVEHHAYGAEVDLKRLMQETAGSLDYFHDYSAEALASLYSRQFTHTVRSLVSPLTTLAYIDPTNSAAPPPHRHIDPDRRRLSQTIARDIYDADMGLHELDKALEYATGRGDRHAADTLTALQGFNKRQFNHAICSARHIATVAYGPCVSPVCMRLSDPPF